MSAKKSPSENSFGTALSAQVIQITKAAHVRTFAWLFGSPLARKRGPPPVLFAAETAADRFRKARSARNSAKTPSNLAEVRGDKGAVLLEVPKRHPRQYVSQKAM